MAMRDGHLAAAVLGTLHTEVITHFHLCCGGGFAAAGFNDAEQVVGNMRAHLECLGGIDVQPGAIANFNRFTGATGTVMDLFTREQYRRHHGKEPPAGWREATVEDIRRAAGYRRPNVLVITAPCKGASGLLSEQKAKTDRYLALNELTLRCVWLGLEAWRDEGGPDMIVFENVPRIRVRMRHLLDQIGQLLTAFDFAYRETEHDCGELAGLSESRLRFLLLARNTKTIPCMLYVPEKKPLKAVGDVLGQMPLPGDPRGGPMHRLPQLQWKSWVRLAFVEAGSDWRSLNKLVVEDGVLRDFLIVPEYRSGYLGVHRWSDTCGAVSSRGGPTNGAYSVSDPRHFGTPKHSNEFAVGPWNKPARAVTSAHGSGQCVSDPRFQQSAKWKDGQAFGVRKWRDSSGAIASQQAPGQGAYAVADPRVAAMNPPDTRFYRVVRRDEYEVANEARVASPLPPDRKLFGKYAVTDYNTHTGTVIAGCDSGAYGVADPRTGLTRGKGSNFLTAGHYGVIPWDSPTGAVSAAGSQDNGRNSVADPRVDMYPEPNDRTTAIITTLDGTVHRPFTTAELAAIQSLFDPSEVWNPDPKIQAEIDERNRRRDWDGFTLHGTSDKEHREHIGNAVPRKAAKVIAQEIARTILLARAGETFTLSSQEIWTRQQIAIATTMPAEWELPQPPRR